MLISNQIKVIIDQYIQNDCHLWTIGTNFVSTWELFAKDLQNKIKNNKINDCYVQCIDKQDNKYIFCINDIQIIMYRKSDGTKYIHNNEEKYCWSLGGMRQFLQEGEAFGFFIFDSRELRNLNSANKTEIELTNNFFQVLEENFMETFHLQLMHSMQKALTSAAKYTADLGFTLFMILLYKNNLRESDDELFISNRMNRTRDGIEMSKSKKFGSESYETEMDRCWHDKKTYVKAIEILDTNFNISTIVNSLSNTFENGIIDFVLTKEEESNETLKHKINEVFDKVDQKRAELRRNILEQRVKGAIKYNDLDNTYPKDWYVQDCDAAHIYDIWRIKRQITNELKTQRQIDSLLIQCSDPNNGILLLKQWHYYFDKDLFSFNEKGEIIIMKNISDRLDPIDFNKKINDVRIKSSVLNNAMKEYLNKRE